MFCRQCGTQMSDTAAFCPSCGVKVVGAPAPSQAQEMHSAPAFSASAFTHSAEQAVKKRRLMDKALLYKALLVVATVVFAVLGGIFLLRLFETLGGAVTWFSTYSELFAFLGTLSYLMCGVIFPIFALLGLSPLVGACLHRGDIQRPVAKRSFVFAFLLCLLCIALWVCTFLFEPVLIGNYAVFIYVFDTFGELAPACLLASVVAVVLLFVARNQCRAANSEGYKADTQEKFVQDVAESKADGQSGHDEQPRRKSKTKPVLIIAGIVVVLAVAASVVAAFALGIFDIQAEISETEAPSTNEEIEAEAEAEVEAETVALAQDPVALEDAQVGDIVEFGSYQQDDTGTQQAIRWIVLAVEDGRAFLLSEQCLDAMQMCRSSSRARGAQWIDSYICEWLNDDFLGEAFSEDEQASIFNTRVGEDEGTAVYNKVFLLSADDLDSYLETSWRTANATVYAQSRGAYVFDDDGVTNWWLRDALNVSSDSESSFLSVYYDGTLNDQGYEATKSNLAVRPALWIAIEGEAEGNLIYGQDMQSDASGSEQNSSSIEQSTTVTLTVQAADGSTLSGEVRRDANGYVIADSSTREYTLEELRSLGLSAAEMCIAWNEPYAREGYVFYNSGLQAYFESCSWYTAKGRDISFAEGSAAALNIACLQQLADESGEAARWRYLADE